MRDSQDQVRFEMLVLPHLEARVYKIGCHAEADKVHCFGHFLISFLEMKSLWP